MNRTPKFAVRWWTFTRERFPLLNHLPVILFFWSAGSLVASRSTGLSPALTLQEFLSAATLFFLFFHLRIFDEIKDCPNDRIVHSDRPLARGLISLKEAKSVAWGLIVLELYGAWLIGLPAFVSLACAVLYSLLMYKEFLLGPWLRPRMEAYALSHTLVSCWMALFLWSSVTGRHFWQIPKTYALWVLACWMIFNIFEFGRKTLGKEEEQDLVESYSKRLGSWGAAGSVLVMAAIAAAIAFRLGHAFKLREFFLLLMAALVGVLVLAGGVYAVTGTERPARTFRTACSTFILFYDLIVTLGAVF
ncbi:MAG: UbiA prenyltransferase family protein [Armatimonadetes bacterium]|nr:UbiA prenyltransferase family protein [Armatimonadota bacterium]